MEITLNGKRKRFDAPLSVSGLLQNLGIDPRSVAVERNMAIIARTDMERELVQEGDHIEIIRMVAGG